MSQRIMSDNLSEKVTKTHYLGDSLVATDQKVGGSNPLGRKPKEIATNRLI